MSGPYSLDVMAEFLGKRRAEVEALCKRKERPLPCLCLPTEKQVRRTFHVSRVTKWLNQTSPVKWEEADVEWELDKAAQNLTAGRKIKAAIKETASA